MTEEVSEEIRNQIFELICLPGIEIEEIAEKVNLDYDKVKEILTDECLRHNLDYGRRLCCR
jgi:hypothetical protein